ESAALEALGAEMGMEVIDLEHAQIDRSLLAEFPQKLIYRHGLFPITRRNGVVVVATSDPLDLYSLDEAGAALGCAIEAVLAPKDSIAQCMRTHLGVGSE